MPWGASTTSSLQSFTPSRDASLAKRPFGTMTSMPPARSAFHVAGWRLIAPLTLGSLAGGWRRALFHVRSHFAGLGGGGTLAATDGAAVGARGATGSGGTGAAE